MSLQVIGTGFGRTGTDSMREALNILGVGPCHHMFEVTQNPVMKARWRAFVGTGKAPDWEALFEGYPSCVDWPSAHYWRELIVAYPDARVILTWRPAESWWASYEKTLMVFQQDCVDQESVGYRTIDMVFGKRFEDRDYVIGLYEANVAAVKAMVPAERLLVHKIGDGWAPLCTHLGVAVPDVPYPRKNSTVEFGERQAKD
jgi:hypothetical protein